MGRRNSKIVTGAMGNLLAPPNYPTHNYRIQTDLRRKPEHRGSMSLEYGLNEQCSWLEEQTITEIRKLLTDWENNKLSLDHPYIKDWIYQCLGYWQTMEETAIRHIQKYYPEYIFSVEDLKHTYWGNRI